MTVVIIDGNGLLWRAAHSLGEQQVAYGVLDYLNTVLEKFSPESMIVCWDSGASRYRLGVYPEYKAHRKKHRDKFDMELLTSQADLARDYLRHKGVQQVRVHGVEADDLISWVSEYISVYLKKQTVIISADRDLWQLTTKSVSTYDLMRGVKTTPVTAQEVFGVEPYLIPQWKAIVGDSSDNIKGIKGLGDKRARALFKEYGCVENMLKPEAVKVLSKSAVTARLYKLEDAYERDLLLTRIPKLFDLVWYLNDKEFISLSSQLLAPVVVNEVSAQGIADTLQKSLITYRKLTPVDFSRMPLQTQSKLTYTGWPELDNTIKICNKCALRADCGVYGPTLAEGYSDVDIMFVGRNPGQTELESGIPFSGASGDHIDTLLETCGLTRRDVWITNVCKCHSENNRPLTIGEIGACSGYLQAEVDLLKPKLIITFGNEAMSLFTSFKQGVSRHSGEMVKHEHTQIEHGAHVVISVHPSAALRSGKSLANFEYATKVVAKYLEKRLGKI